MATTSDASDEPTSFDAPDSSSPAHDPGSPDWMLWAAGGALAVGALLLASGLVGLYFVGYLLSAPVAFTLVALFRRRTLERVVRVGIAPSPRANAVGLAILVAGFVVAIVHAIFIGSWYA